jgi:hypothetical protein
MTRHAGVGLVTAAAFLLVGNVWAQSASSGIIAGEAKDTTGAMLPGVTVEAASPALIEKVRTVVTDSRGQFKIVDLRPGTYTVTFNLGGFSTFKRDNVVITAGFTGAVDAEMRLGGVEETITVSGASPTVDIQNVRAQSVLSRTTLDTLPNSRSFNSYAALTVGATASVDGGGQDVGGTVGDSHGFLVIHGGWSNDGELLYDGMNVNEVGGGGTIGGSSQVYYTNQAGVQEVVLSTAGMSAESSYGGVSVNAVPKDGGNTFQAYFSANGAGESFQAGNNNDALRARGVRTTVPIKKLWDFGGGLGGPLMKESLWFYTAHRTWGSQNYVPGNYYNKTHGTNVYTPDLDRPAFTDNNWRDNSLRLTWRAAEKHKFTAFGSYQKNCLCNFFTKYGIYAPDASVSFALLPVYLIQGTWTFPLTSRVLIEAGGSFVHNLTEARQDSYVLPTDISITELSRNYQYNAYASAALSAGQAGSRYYHPQTNQRFSVSYVTGSHNVKLGLTNMSGKETYESIFVNQAINYRVLNGAPASLTQWASPAHQEMSLKANLGLFAQDQWTLRRLTLNLGLRFDYLNAYVPAQTRPAGRFTSAFTFEEIKDLPNYKDLSPRLGAAVDLFGNGKTALKVSVSRYVQALGTAIARVANPSNAIVQNADRTWADVNDNFVPDCDLSNREANGECGRLSNQAFGTLGVLTKYDPDLLTGFGKRPYNWQTSAGVQHELFPGTAVDVAYYRSAFGNFTILDNTALTGLDYDPYCITAPVDARLPGGGGYPVCGLFNEKPSKFGLVKNEVTLDSRYGRKKRVFNGVDAALKASVGNGVLISGGVSVGRTHDNTCFAADSPQVTIVGTPRNVTAASPLNISGAERAVQDFCDVVPPWLSGTQVKLSAVYPLPWEFQVAGTFQNLPGVPRTAQYVASSAEIRQSLGRNPAACPTTDGPCTATVLVDILPFQSQFEDRISQFDLRFTKKINVGRARIQGMFDIYNLLNVAGVTGVNARYGAAWLLPTQIMGGRLFKLGAQLDF